MYNYYQHQLFPTTFTNNNYSMICVKINFFIAHNLAQSVTFRFVEHQAIELRIIRDIVVKAQAILMAHFELPILDAAKGRAPWHMRM